MAGRVPVKIEVSCDYRDWGGQFQKQSNFRIARYPGVIHVTESTLMMRVHEAVLAAYVFYERIVAYLPSVFDK
jgi:hypothetical protein